MDLQSRTAKHGSGRYNPKTEVGHGGLTSTFAASYKRGDYRQTYNINGHNETTNIEVVKGICDILDVLVPQKPAFIQSYGDLVAFVSDRPGHDKRYAADASKISPDLRWKPIENPGSGLQKTVKCFLENEESCGKVISGDYLLNSDRENQR